MDLVSWVLLGMGFFIAGLIVLFVIIPIAGRSLGNHAGKSMSAYLEEKFSHHETKILHAHARADDAHRIASDANDIAWEAKNKIDFHLNENLTGKKQ